MDKKHKSLMKAKWKYRGVLLREGETYDMIYKKVYSTSNCELCNLSFDGNNKPEMDHSHETGYFRKVLCRSCNSHYKQLQRGKYKSNKSGHKYIAQRKNGYYSVAKRINNKNKGHREFKNKTDAICYKYILLLKIKSKYYINDG
jgi:hypothetical protein